MHRKRWLTELFHIWKTARWSWNIIPALIYATGFVIFIAIFDPSTEKLDEYQHRQDLKNGTGIFSGLKE